MYRHLLYSPVLRDMVNTARLYPGGRVKIIELRAILLEEPPREASVSTSSVMLHRFLITGKELEILYSLVSTEYLVSLRVTGVFGTTGMVKTELSMQVLKWEGREGRMRRPR